MKLPLILLYFVLLSSCFCQDLGFEPDEESCEFIEQVVNEHTSTGGIRFIDYPSPETLDLDELQKGISERKEILKNYTLNESLIHHEIITLLVETASSENVTEILLPMLECLSLFQDPDFIILYLVRILFMTDEYDELIIPYIEEIPLWLTNGESSRIYWSENHMIMYTSSAYLLRQKFPERFPATDDPTLDERLEWFLKTKSEFGFFEFNSQLYMRFTSSALLNVYDFAEDPKIKALAHDCTTRYLLDYVEATNSYGVSSIASARTFQFYFFKGERPSNYSRVYGYAHQEAMSMITGLGPLIVEGEILISTAFLLQTTFDLTPIAAAYTPELYVTRSFGTSYEDGKDFLFKNLSREDRFVAQMSMGGYANPDFINDFVSLVETYDMWEHDSFAGFKVLASLPSGMVKSLSGMISSIVSGSHLFASDVKIYKNHNVMLSSLTNYFPGFKVYQQFPWAAVIGDEAVFTQSLPQDIWNTTDAREQMLTNSQMPYLIQDQNMMLAIYNPNVDLQLIGSGGLEVGFHFDISNFAEVVDGRDLEDSDDRWIFGRHDDGYIAVFRHCINDEHRFKICFDLQQIWMVVVGNNRTHGTFSDFVVDISKDSSIRRNFAGKCVSVKGDLDGKAFDEKFCRNLGSAYVALIWVIFYIVFQTTCCFVCCRKKRKVWKKFVRNTREAVFQTKEDLKTGSKSSPVPGSKKPEGDDIEDENKNLTIVSL